MADLQKLLEELSHYKRDRNDLLTYYINKRLNESLEVYYKELDESVHYLQARETRMARKMK